VSTFKNLALSASAGTGKTWALTHRFLALMAAGVAPERICALTFSRKAAGEIFDAIVERLCLAASDERQRAQTVASLKGQMESVTAPDSAAEYLRLLRRLLEQVQGLRIGTLDSFIVGVARLFPFELGLPPDLRPLDNDGNEAAAIRSTLLARLCDPRWNRRADAASNDGGAGLLNAFRQAMFGQENKSLANRLDSLIRQNHHLFRESSHFSWGRPERIWPSGRWWEASDLSALKTAADPAYQTELASSIDNSEVCENLVKIAATGAAHGPESPYPDKLSKTILPRLLEHARAGTRPVFPYRKKNYEVSPELWPPLAAAISNIVAVEVERVSQRTAGLHDILQRYDVIQQEAQRREGRLAFDEFALRLGEPGSQPSSLRDAADRIYIDYRLDGRIDHWLLDEFQDTSDAQWQAIANLIDEVVQDAGESRSFFYVGDIKQSIYGWRGGNHRLFGQIAARDGIKRANPLTDCHRSLPAVIDAVNNIFTNLPDWTPLAGADKGPHPAAVAAFMAEWNRHNSARRGAGTGFAALLQYEKAPAGTAGAASEGDDEDGAAQFEAVARILAEVQPLQRGLTAAVLTRDNTQGRTCANLLRQRLPEMPVVHEGTGGILDNPLVALLLALLRYAAHPADKLARRHLQMSPLGHLAASRGHTSWLADFSVTTLQQIHAIGFAGTLRHWGGELTAAGALKPDDHFSRQRFAELLAAAASFDATGSRDVDAFAEHVRACMVKTESTTGTIRVMTIHQSKGLGFDIVIVPFSPNAKSFTNLGDAGLLMEEQAHGEGWVLQSLPRDILDAVGGAPVRALEQERVESNFGQLCVLYVALTRAKQGLYMLIPEPAKKPKTVREADLLSERLAQETDADAELYGLKLLAQFGESCWYEAFAPDQQKTADASRAQPSIAPLPLQFTREIQRHEPSKDRAAHAAFPAHLVFDAEMAAVRSFGSAIHRLFEDIEWLEDCDVERLVRQWRENSAEPASLLDDVEKQFRQSIAADEVRRLLHSPDSATTVVWREAPFSLVMEKDGRSELMSGRFDRVVIERDSAGKPQRATIVDYKSNRVANEAEMQRVAEGYAPQMRDYALAAARILDLPAEAVSASLLFTRLARVFTLTDL